MSSSSSEENENDFVSKSSWCCEEYSTLLLAKLHSSYNSGFLTDLTINVEDKAFKVHKVVLAGASDYFAAMFSHNMVEAEKESINLKGVDSVTAFEVVTRFIYTGKIDLSMDNVQDILQAATFLQVPSATKLCMEFLKHHLTFGNSKDYLALADLFGLKDLQKFYRKFLLTHFLEFADTEQFLIMDSDTLIDLLGDDALRTTSETKLLKKVLNWYNHDKENREAVAHNVFEKIRLTADGWPAHKLASEEEPFISNPRCIQILKDMSSYMSIPEKRCVMQTPNTRVRYDSETLVQFGGKTSFDLALSEQGCDQNRYYHPELKTWQRLGCISVMPKPRSHWKAVEIDGHLILCGGFCYNFIEDFRTTTNNVQTFEPSHLSLWDLPKMNFDRAFHDVAYLSGCVYAIGGQSATTALSSVECLDIMKGEWTMKKSLPLPRYYHAAAASNGRIYISGGVEVSDAEVHSIVDILSCYCPDQNIWSTLSPMLSGRKAHTMTVYSDQLYVCGGIAKRLQSSHTLSSVEVYNIELNQWTYLSGMLLPVHDMAATVLNGKILIVGGDSLSGCTDMIQQFDPDKNKWTKYGELWQPLRNLCCCAVKIRIKDCHDVIDNEDYYDSEVDSVHDYYNKAMEMEVLEDNHWTEYDYDDSHWEEYDYDDNHWEVYDYDDYHLEEDDFDNNHLEEQ